MTAYTRELLTGYPIDALRYDMLFGPKKCLCDGCKAYLQGTLWRGALRAALWPA